MTTDTKHQFDAARQGDGEAFNQLVAQFRPRLERFCQSRMGEGLRRWVSVDDVLQEAALKALQSMGRIEWQGENAYLILVPTESKADVASQSSKRRGTARRSYSQIRR